MSATFSLKSIGFILGLIIFVLILWLPPFQIFIESAQQSIIAQKVSLEPEILATSMQSVFGLFLLMIIWWVTEAIPLPITALLPAIILPFLHTIGFSGDSIYEFTIKNVLISYANPVIYLFLGGFLIAAAMQKWGLDRRLTLWILTRGNLANSTHSILLGMMAVTAFLSMWISNTATTAMMLPLGLGVLHFLNLKPGESHFGTALMLGIAWAASIGGVGTIIGTPPNGIALGILNSTFANDPNFHRITFLDWMKIGIPYVCFMIPIAWMILIVLNPPELRNLFGGKKQLQEEKIRLGKFNRGEKLTIVAFFLSIILWVSNPFWNSLLPTSIAARVAWIDEYSIGLLVGALCFLFPVDFKNNKFLLDWSDTKFVDWGTLILFGGGIALSDAMFKTGLASWIASSFVGLFGNPSTFLLMIIIVFLIDFLTEVTSNTAVTGMIVPIIISIAIKTGNNPITLSVAAAISASMAFMLPVATPPNALVYGTGYIKLKEMIRNGFTLDILGWIATVLILYVFGGVFFGILTF